MITKVEQKEFSLHCSVKTYAHGFKSCVGRGLEVALTFSALRVTIVLKEIQWQAMSDVGVVSKRTQGYTQKEKHLNCLSNCQRSLIVKATSWWKWKKNVPSQAYCTCRFLPRVYVGEMSPLTFVEISYNFRNPLACLHKKNTKPLRFETYNLLMYMLYIEISAQIFSNKVPSSK